MNEITENEHVKLWFEGDILYSYYKKGCYIGIQEAKEVVKLRLEFQKGKSYDVLCFVDHLGKITPEARKFFAEDGYEGMHKLALFFTSPIKAIIGNMFIKIDKPVKPTRLFYNTDEALKWLKSE